MIAQLKRVAKVFTGTTPPTNVNYYYESEDVLWYTPSNISSDNIGLSEPKKISKSYFTENRVSLFPSNVVLMVGIGATVGKIGYSPTSCYSNQQINAIVFDKKKVLPKFGAYFLLNKSIEINKQTPVVTLQIFNQNKVKQIELDIPSLQVQQRIVEYLDAKTTEIDKKIELLGKKRDAYNRLKTATINRAVTRGLDEHVPLKDSGMDWIGEIPEHWDVKRCKDYTDIIMGQSPNGEDIDVVGEIFFMQGKAEFGTIYPCSKYFCETCTKFSRKQDILMSVRAPVGELNISDKVYGIGRGLCSIKAIKIEMKYLWYYLHTQKKYLNSLATGSTFLAITPDKISNLMLVFPSMKEQKQIAAYLDERCAKIDAAVTIIDKQIDALKRLKRSLINEVVTGKRAV